MCFFLFFFWVFFQLQIFTNICQVYKQQLELVFIVHQKRTSWGICPKCHSAVQTIHTLNQTHRGATHTVWHVASDTVKNIIVPLIRIFFYMRICHWKDTPKSQMTLSLSHTREIYVSFFQAKNRFILCL